MVTGWRRAFCTSIPKEPEPATEKQPPGISSNTTRNSGKSPRLGSKLGFFSNPSTPRFQSQPVSSPSLRCRTTVATIPTSSLPSSPKLHCRTTASPTNQQSRNNSPRLFHFSDPSSPKSPSSFSFLKATLRLSKGRCGICLQSLKTGQGAAIFTAQCSHSFHFHCVAALIKKRPLLNCPVCSSVWKELPLLAVQQKKPEAEAKQHKDIKTKPLRVYNDDEPLASPVSLAHFNPIPESDETENDDAGEEEFQGFFVSNNSTPRISKGIVVTARNVNVRLLPDAPVLAANRSYETFVVVLKVKAPALPAALWSRRAPIDLVAVVDVSGSMNGGRLQMIKHAMRLVISSLGETDRLSIVAFSTGSKRLSPLRRMNSIGRRSARQIVDALGSGGEGMSVSDALKKAAKVLEDRREKNAFASIVVLCGGQSERAHTSSHNQNRPVVSSTRFADTEIPVHSISVGACVQIPNDDVFSKIVSGLFSLVIQDLTLQLGFLSGSAPAEIASVYLLTGKPACLGTNTVRVGDLSSEEERELLVEIKVPGSSSGSHRVMSVRSSHKDPFSQMLVHSNEQGLLIPRPQIARSSSSQGIWRLRNLHISARAVAESRRLVERNDLSGAYHLLSSARALLIQSGSGSANEFLRCVEAELGEVGRLRQLQSQSVSVNCQADGKPEPLTPTSAWRAAERLAKVAIMRKHMNRVSDLHGFENARF